MSNIESLDFSEIRPGDKQAPLLESNLEIIKDVKVTLQVQVGEATVTVDELMNLGENSVVRLDCETTTPINLILDGKVVARGHLVAADDNFGVQITELGD